MAVRLYSSALSLNNEIETALKKYQEYIQWFAPMERRSEEEGYVWMISNVSQLVFELVGTYDSIQKSKVEKEEITKKLLKQVQEEFEKAKERTLKDCKDYEQYKDDDPQFDLPSWNIKYDCAQSMDAIMKPPKPMLTPLFLAENLRNCTTNLDKQGIVFERFLNRRRHVFGAYGTYYTAIANGFSAILLGYFIQLVNDEKFDKETAEQKIKQVHTLCLESDKELQKYDKIGKERYWDKLCEDIKNVVNDNNYKNNDELADKVREKTKLYEGWGMKGLFALCQNEVQTKTELHGGRFYNFSAQSAFNGSRWYWYRGHGKDVEINEVDMQQNKLKFEGKKFEVYEYFRDLFYDNRNEDGNVALHFREQIKNKFQPSMVEIIYLGISDHEELFSDKYLKEILPDHIPLDSNRKVRCTEGIHYDVLTENTVWDYGSKRGPPTYRVVTAKAVAYVVY